MNFSSKMRLLTMFFQELLGGENLEREESGLTDNISVTIPLQS